MSLKDFHRLEVKIFGIMESAAPPTTILFSLATRSPESPSASRFRCRTSRVRN